MIEIDTDKNLEQIEPIVRINLDKIQNLFLENDIIELKKYFGDDDVLGVKKLPFNMFKSFSFKGINLFDSYEYKVEIK